MPMLKTPRAARTLAHRILLVYNAIVVFLLAGFMSVTQQKIIASMNARAFLEDLPAMPLSPELGLALPLCALLCSGRRGIFIGAIRCRARCTGRASSSRSWRASPACAV